MQKILLLGFWFTTTTATLIVSLVLIVFLPSHLQPSVKGAATENVELRSTYKMFASIPSVNYNTQENIKVNDARVEIVKQFLAKYDSPLEPFASLLVETADKYHLDFRLLPAVAMQESTLCKKTPENSHNCWGYGIYGDKVMRFDSFDQAIERVAKGLSQDYVFDGLTTPELIMGRYTPSSNGSWAESVRYFMEKME